ncbi:hypothetical protein EJB05_15145 [Eragrostis curvula]|uniref:Uncharacterized protein n=1 Tax=Eragrostis curvula TaxID=38414 RepID=A0A5J9W133_9POAL|nr:hypothetical protein EJB05_15145 [Eragrostis curvula]
MRHDDLYDPDVGSDELPPINLDANVGISRWRPCYALRLGEQVYRDFRWVDDEHTSIELNPEKLDDNAENSDCHIRTKPE